MNPEPIEELRRAVFVFLLGLLVMSVAAALLFALLER